MVSRLQDHVGEPTAETASRQSARILEERGSTQRLTTKRIRTYPYPDLSDGRRPIARINIPQPSSAVVGMTIHHQCLVAASLSLIIIRIGIQQRPTIPHLLCKGSTGQGYRRTPFTQRGPRIWEKGLQWRCVLFLVIVLSCLILIPGILGHAFDGEQAGLPPNPFAFSARLSLCFRWILIYTGFAFFPVWMDCVSGFWQS
jgi:hypothetical protein